jgi:hypothetical protein
MSDDNSQGEIDILREQMADMRLTDKEWEQIKDITQYLSDHDCDDWVDTLRGVLNRLG